MSDLWAFGVRLVPDVRVWVVRYSWANKRYDGQAARNLVRRLWPVVNKCDRRRFEVRVYSDGWDIWRRARRTQRQIETVQKARAALDLARDEGQQEAR